MDEIIRSVEAPMLREDLPDFKPGDTVKVHFMVREGDKERVQIYQGVVIARRGGGISESITVKKVSGGVNVERVFPLHSPLIQKIEVTRIGKVRRAKLFYLRNKTGKAARIAEKKTWSESKKS